MRSWKPFSALLALGALGCRADHPRFPLREGQEWTYTVRTGYVTYVEPVKVARELSVAGTRGFELSGPMGTSRLAWKGGVLLADRYVNVRLEPPMPVLAGGRDEATMRWTGRLMGLGPGKPAEASLSQRPEALRVGTRQVQAIRTDLTLQDGTRRIEVVSWYEDGVGLVRQEHRTDGRLDVQLELLAGPK